MHFGFRAGHCTWKSPGAGGVTFRSFGAGSCGMRPVGSDVMSVLPFGRRAADVFRLPGANPASLIGDLPIPVRRQQDSNPFRVQAGRCVATRLVCSIENSLANAPPRIIRCAGAPSSTIEVPSRTITRPAAIASWYRCVITTTV